MAAPEQNFPFSYSDECLKNSIIDFARKNLNTPFRGAAALLIVATTYGSVLAEASVSNEAKASVTPIPRSGQENAPDSECTTLFKEVASGNATQDQIRQYNDLVRAEITILGAPEKEGLIAVPCVAGDGINPENSRLGVGYLNIRNELVLCLAK